MMCLRRLEHEDLSRGDESAYPPMPFIVGVGRSGTTLLRLMLDAHPQLAIPAETNFILPVMRARSWFTDRREHFFAVITGLDTWNDFGLPSEDFRQALRDLEPFSVAKGIRAFYRLYAERLGKSRWGDKTPKYCRHMHTIQRLLPEAYFIHLIRDGRDVALSLPSLLSFRDYDIETLARCWCRTIKVTRRLGRRCAHYREIRYESLIREPVKTLTEICEFLLLPYDAHMQEYYQQARLRLAEVKARLTSDGRLLMSQGDRLDNHRLTSRPPDTSRVLHWKHDMTLDAQERFERIAGRVLEKLDYECTLSPKQWLRPLRRLRQRVGV